MTGDTPVRWGRREARGTATALPEACRSGRRGRCLAIPHQPPGHLAPAWPPAGLAADALMPAVTSVEQGPGVNMSNMSDTCCSRMGDSQAAQYAHQDTFFVLGSAGLLPKEKRGISNMLVLSARVVFGCSAVVTRSAAACELAAGCPKLNARTGRLCSGLAPPASGNAQPKRGWDFVSTVLTEL